MSCQLPLYSNHLFSFDIGTNSIGWCVLELDKVGVPASIKDIGVRIFSDGREPAADGKRGASLAVARREARSMRRMRDRYQWRRKKTLSVLVEYGLQPADEAERKKLVAETGDQKPDSTAPKIDPYNLRRRALTEKLPPYYIGRALFQLGQRRGFKSNRKTDRKSNEKGQIAVAVEELSARIQMAGVSTLGAYLAMQREKGHVIRIRAGSEAFSEKNDYAFYPERSMLEDEFHKIWDAQAEFYPDILTKARKEDLFKIIFYQRPLKKPIVGKCSFNPAEERLPKAHPLFQEFRLYKEVNELGVRMPDMYVRKLTVEERDKLIWQLRQKKKPSFAALRKTLKLSNGLTFNKESKNRTDMMGDEVYTVMADKKRFGNRWSEFSHAEQWQIIKELRDEENPAILKNWLQETFGLTDEEQLAAIMDAPLPDGYGRLGQTAMAAMLEKLKEDVIPEAEAARRCGYNHTLYDREHEGHDELPKYQEILEQHILPGTGNPDDSYDIEKGRITNPTVHIGLNQLRRLVNRLLHKHGKPAKMVVELARDLQLSDKQKKEVNKTIGENTRAAEKRSEKLKEQGERDNGYNQLLLKLWEELNEKPEDRVCIYSGKPINIEMLFSGAVDIDHILPWSKTLDDSQANKILCLKEANRQKRNRAPAEVTEWNEKYDDILARAARLPKNKQWRFARDAMKRAEGENDFLARQLTDTQYLSRMAVKYLDSLYPAEEPDEHGELKHRKHVWVIPGRLTEMLRRNWGLNDILADAQITDTNKPKNRHDHRHHAIDAAVIGVTSRALLQRIVTAAAKMEQDDLENLVTKIVKDNQPWQGFSDDLAQAIAGIIVSHKPDHGTVSRASYAQGKGQTAGRFHEETAYGLTGQRDNRGKTIVVWRVPFLSLKEKDIINIRDDKLRSEVEIAVYGKDGKDFEKALRDFQQKHLRYKGIRRVRITGTRNVLQIKDADGKAYKGYRGGTNYRYDVWLTLDGKWHSEVISTFGIHQPGWVSAFHAQNPTAKKVLSLQQNDMVAYEHPEDGYTIARVVEFYQDGKIAFSPHNEANVARRNKNKGDPFKYFVKMANPLKAIQCRQVRIDEIGQVYDAGFQG
ncbi:MAG: CRISPR-associated protein Cas9 [Candidatus Tokpelaia hoelldobleri]|uniref:CRISPR-associated endonuclease Cas9 n=1 Tax=Candidatus Tokpelaia hoelldobleri TaxID=1902579 RepID=A0A1U9JTZ3_9HYPH|nr:MAG: CRISPR-associated protein Cas9 [Candidatus Tokpelaia hoelldoblerii]